jgi:type IV secretory pathway TrbF-like protein
MTSDITRGGQGYISREGLQRSVTRYSLGIAGIALGGWMFTTGIAAWLAAQPRDVPYILMDTNGHLEPLVRATTPTQDDTKKLLVDWVGAWRAGCNDPTSMCAKETAQPLSSDPKDMVVAQVRAYNQSVADNHEKVSPDVTSFRALSDNQYEVRWTETATTDAQASSVRIMRAIITTGQSAALISLHGALINPWGIAITDLRIVQQGASK